MLLAKYSDTFFGQISVTEWFVNFYKETKKKDAYKPFECIQKPGELLFIPHAWWHQALNFEESVAVTQNVVDRQNLVNVADFLKKKKKPELWQKFSTELQASDPDLFTWLQSELEIKEKAARAAAGPTRSTALLDNGGTQWTLNLFGAN
jgi:ribosomal protein L16 Arg81 hydroxylase